jgi:tetratricopeptide (TPR) repeat protein
MSKETSVSSFRELRTVPCSAEEVIPQTLDPAFRRKCLEHLDLLEQICNCPAGAGTTLFVGAGISAFQPARMPLAWQTLDKLFTYAAEFCPELEVQMPMIRRALQSGEGITFEGTLQHLFEIVHPRPFYTVRVFDVPLLPPRFNVCHEFLARWMNTGREYVVTTNLDPLIEHAWHHIRPDLGPPTVIRRPRDFEEWESRIGESGIIWKLHGSVDDPESWMVTLGTVAFELRDARAAFLGHVMQHHSVCFVGWRGADLDIFPCVYRALKQGAPESLPIFWVFYYREGNKALEDYLRDEPFAARLFEISARPIYPIVTTAERLFSWLLKDMLGVEPSLPDLSVSYPVDYNWLRLDLHTAHELGIHKLVGFVLRNAGEYPSSVQALDNAGELATLRAAQLIQEAAQTCWQQGQIPQARDRVEKAWRLLREANDPLSTAWCEYGRTTMALDGARAVSLQDKLVALVRLRKLRQKFAKLLQEPKWENSPKLGIGLCTFYETKLLDRMADLLHLKGLRFVRQLLFDRYRVSEEFIQVGGHAPALVDVKRKVALLLAYDNRESALEEINEAIRLAKAVGQRYYTLTLDTAIELAGQLEDSTTLSFAVREKQRMEEGQ